MKIEVELKSLVTKDMHDGLIGFFTKNGRLVSEDEQETHYFDRDGNVRIQRNGFHSKVCFKHGKIHDEQREESEIIFGRDDFPKLESLFAGLGYRVHVKWLRKRHTFEWNDVTATVDETRGYGCIVELEKMSDDASKDSDLAMLREKFKLLGIEQTPKEELERRFGDYLQNWRSLWGSDQRP